MARLPKDPLRAADRAARSDISRTIVRATNHAITRREELLQEFDFEGERGRINELRQNATTRLPHLLEQFLTRLQDLGIKTLLARDAKEAQRLIIDVAKSHNVREVIKSKSMTTEELGLREAMEREGLRVLETDLGELIVQLRGEPPSHLTAPAVHLTTKEVAEVFEKEGISQQTEPEEMARDVRRWMRPHLLNAQMGIAGANAAAASEGALLMMSNEGNIRMVLTLPRVLVVVVGVDKLVESVRDFAPLVRVIPKNATGQRITNYVTTMIGPNPGQKMYVLVVDNGRLSVPGWLSPALWCVRCAACINVCPVYRTIGGHAYGTVYVGPMGILLNNALGLYEDAHRLANLCTLCGACAQVCAAKIDIPTLILQIRARAPANWWERLKVRAVEFVYSSTRRFRRVFELLRAFSWLALPYRLLWRLMGWKGKRGVPQVAREEFDELYHSKRIH